MNYFELRPTQAINVMEAPMDATTPLPPHCCTSTLVHQTTTPVPDAKTP